MTAAITAFEEEGSDAAPLLNGCRQATARLIFDEVTEAYLTVEQAARLQAGNSTLARGDYRLPYTSPTAPNLCGITPHVRGCAMPPSDSRGLPWPSGSRGHVFTELVRHLGTRPNGFLVQALRMGR
ncbi:hypothetical protein ACIQSP_27230 [Streptomyces nigra]